MTRKEEIALSVLISRYLLWKDQAEYMTEQIKYYSPTSANLEYWENERATWERVSSDLFEFLNNCHIEEDKEDGQNEKE